MDSKTYSTLPSTKDKSSGSNSVKYLFFAVFSLFPTQGSLSLIRIILTLAFSILPIKCFEIISVPVDGKI